MPIEVRCPRPSCALDIAVESEHDGLVVACPGCKTHYRVLGREKPPRLRPIAYPVREKKPRAANEE